MPQEPRGPVNLLDLPPPILEDIIFRGGPRLRLLCKRLAALYRGPLHLRPKAIRCGHDLLAFFRHPHPRVTTLSLHLIHPTLITPALLHLIPLSCPSLANLQLPAAHCTPASLSLLSSAPHLTSLDLHSHTAGIPPALLATLPTALPNLQSLTLSAIADSPSPPSSSPSPSYRLPPPAPSLTPLCRCTHLTHLAVSSALHSLESSFLALAASLPRLASLRLPHLTPEGASALPLLLPLSHTLHSLQLSSPTLSAPLTPTLAALTSLTSLSLSLSSWPDAAPGWAPLTLLPRLHTLSLTVAVPEMPLHPAGPSGPPDALLESIAPLPTLRRLTLTNRVGFFKLSEAGAICLRSAATTLTHLHLVCLSLPANFISAAAGLHRLTHLALDDCVIGNNAAPPPTFQDLTHLQTLRTLLVRGRAVGLPPIWDYLAHLTKLETLELRGCCVVPGSLSQLGRLRELRHLALQGWFGKRDMGAEKELGALKQFEGLEELELTGLLSRQNVGWMEVPAELRRFWVGSPLAEKLRVALVRRLEDRCELFVEDCKPWGLA